jgi:hypothetical protein
MLRDAIRHRSKEMHISFVELDRRAGTGLLSEVLPPAFLEAHRSCGTRPAGASQD